MDGLSELGSGTLRLLREDSAAGEATGEEIHIGGAAGLDLGGRIAEAGEGGIVAEEPGAGNFGEDAAEDRFVELIVGETIGGGEVGGPGEEDVGLAGGEGGGDGALPRAPVVLPEEGGAVIDGSQALVPDEEVGVARGAIDVGSEGVKLDQKRGFSGSCEVACGGIEHAGAGKEVHADVPADAAFEQIADLGVGLVAAELGVDFEEDQIGDGELERAGDATRDEFGDEGERTLTGTAELEDIEAEIIRFDDGRERAALAERHDIADGADATQRWRGSRRRREEARWCGRQRCASLRGFFP